MEVTAVFFFFSFCSRCSQHVKGAATEKLKTHFRRTRKQRPALIPSSLVIITVLLLGSKEGVC